MGFGSRKRGDLERFNWCSIHGELEKRVLNSQEELKKLFPKKKEYGEIRAVAQGGGNDGGSGFVRYVQLDKNGKNIVRSLAYQCGQCKKIIIGPPNIKDIDNIKPLRGREGYDVNCTQCFSKIYGLTTALS